MDQEDHDTQWDALADQSDHYREDQYPFVTVVIPTFQSSQWIGPTLESVLNQDYPRFEVIVIDASSSDRTLEVVKGFREERVKIYSVTGFNRYEMLNKGISLGKGEYINFIFPGD